MPFSPCPQNHWSHHCDHRLAGAANAADSPKDIMRKGLEAVFTTYDKARVEQLFTEDYIQHNPAVPTGRAPIVGFLPALKESGIRLRAHRIISEGDLVVAHNSYDNAKLFGADRIVAFDVFRVKGGRIVEHWDNISPVAPPNPSGGTQVDGPTETADLEKTVANKALVTDFVDAILVKGNLARLAGFFDGDSYIQQGWPDD